MVNGTAQQRISRALPLLTDAHAAIPNSPVITVTLANVWRARNEFARALTLYDEALMVRPTQRDALLGRAMTLTYLGRTDGAIATATKMIELGTWYLGDAYYWRAWNLYQRGQLDAAADDVVNAKQLQRSGALLTLSGMIAYDQTRRIDARRDFDAAKAMNPGTNCPAMWYLGLINLDERLRRRRETRSRRQPSATPRRRRRRVTRWRISLPTCHPRRWSSSGGTTSVASPITCARRRARRSTRRCCRSSSRTASGRAIRSNRAGT
jgi:tetratricopeptide (TPR) repeat protein